MTTTLTLHGKHITVNLLEHLEIEIHRQFKLLWSTSSEHVPTIVLSDGTACPLHTARHQEISHFEEAKHVGHRIQLSGFADSDAAVELILAIDASVDELLVQIEQVGGTDPVRQIDHLYRLDKPVTDGGYLVIPHGSGYLLPADCPDALPGDVLPGDVPGGDSLVGARWTLPLFGMVSDQDGLCVIIDTWWDCHVDLMHIPTKQSTLDINWRGSLGRLSYPRRMRLRSAPTLDYLAMAKLYRQQAKAQGLLRTLEEKAKETPVIKQYIENVLFRWSPWDVRYCEKVLDDIRKMRSTGLGVNFFFPKWCTRGYEYAKAHPDNPEDMFNQAAHGDWQSYELATPVEGGWPTLSQYAQEIRQLGCKIQGFAVICVQFPHGPGYDEARFPVDHQGQRLKDDYKKVLSTHDALNITKRVLDHLKDNGLHYDVLYYDGFSRHRPHVEDYSPSHPVTHRDTSEAVNACFAETRRRGIMPGGEMPRFWSVAECDYFFFTDWSADRLTNTPSWGADSHVGEPIPLFQLVFHDCFIAGFPGGGYACQVPGFDWWPDRTPRLYELLFASAPAYNWLPDGSVPIQDRNSPETAKRFEWLKRWSAYYRAIATSEMISHRFLSDDYKQHRIEFANGISLDVDLEKNLCRVKGVSGFSGEWQMPSEDIGTYPTKPAYEYEQQDVRTKQ